MHIYACHVLSSESSSRHPEREYDNEQHPPPPKPSGSFTIDFPLAQPRELPSSSSFEALRESHSIYIESLLPQDPNPIAPSAAASSPFPWMSASEGAVSSNSPSSTTHSTTAAAASATPATTGSLHTVHNMQARPTFNIASAESLLATFRSMLEFCPCIILPEDVTVQDLAQTRPFVLLAILAAAAGSRTLQGHNLYDEEFRRVFALKLVAGGERSVELLQGVLIYCLWYPFHLRPRVKQVFQYTRMAADLVHDLELDVDTSSEAAAAARPITPERLNAIRAYITQYYLSSS
ncbi:hypothetical protein NQ176_g9976 [Zarea fungicola]|uniref:Uncharacterized protein n=1 Tax=Zarea fungicola TaxID=93591 RepID=A0ACC1MIF9_9HYPO|nr:hypothetical protein NQ176_g9976 [Lecanicillium fungicola]